MKNFISKHVDIEISSDFNFNKIIRVLLFNVPIAKFKIEQGSTEIKRI